MVRRLSRSFKRRSLRKSRRSLRKRIRGGSNMNPQGNTCDDKFRDEWNETALKIDAQNHFFKKIIENWSKGGTFLIFDNRECDNWQQALDGSEESKKWPINVGVDVPGFEQVSRMADLLRRKSQKWGKEQVKDTRTWTGRMKTYNIQWYIHNDNGTLKFSKELAERKDGDAFTEKYEFRDMVNCKDRKCKKRLGPKWYNEKKIVTKPYPAGAGTWIDACIDELCIAQTRHDSLPSVPYQEPPSVPARSTDVCDTQIRRIKKLGESRNFTDICKMVLIKKMVAAAGHPLTQQIANYNLQNFENNGCFKDGNLSVSKAVQTLIENQGLMEDQSLPEILQKISSLN